MLRHLQTRWLEYGRFTHLLAKDDACWELMRAIAALFPRYDRPGQWGFDIEPLRQNPNEIESLFLLQMDGDQAKACRLIELNHFEPLPRPPQDEEEALDLAITPSDDPNADLLANLTAGLGDRFTEAWAAYTTLSAEEIDRYLFTLNQLRRDPEERKQENLAADYAAWKEENQETYREAVGLKFRRPDD